MAQDLTNPFDPDRFAKQMAADDMLRALLITAVVSAMALTLVLPGAAVVSGLVAPAIVLGLWMWVSISTAKVARSLTSFSQLMATEPVSYTHLLDHFGLDLYGQGHTGLLFNLKDDPRQSNNLYEKHPDKVQAMRALLKQYIEGKRCAPLR